MRDKEAREQIADLEKQLHEIKWELKHRIWAIEAYLGVEVKSEPAKTFLVKREKEESK